MNWQLENLISIAQSMIMNYGLKILAALAILIFGRIVSGVAKSLFLRMTKRTQMDVTISSFIANIIYYGFLVFFIIAALGQLGIQTGSFVAIIGAIGLSVALAFQGSLSNFAAGFLIIFFRPFKAGDYIEGGGVAGTVKEIQIFSTILMTPDNKKVVVPNAKLTGDNIINFTTEESRRIDLTVGVSYADDLEKTKNILQSILSTYSEILPDPAPVIAVSKLGDSSVDIVIRPWVKTTDYWNVYFRLTEEIKTRFDKEGITIPFPQQDVYIHKKDS